MNCQNICEVCCCQTLEFYCGGPVKCKTTSCGQSCHQECHSSGCYWRCDTCTHTVCDECCDPQPCSGCTPTCPSGQSTNVSGPLCKSGTISSCTGNDGCGASCTKTGADCYWLETNVANASAPSSVILTLDGINYNLSTNPSSPTTIKPANSSSSASLAIYPTISADININRGVGYVLRANNKGVNNEWATFNCSASDDFCREDTPNSYAFTPSVGLVNALKPNATGDIGGLYYSINRCDDGRKYSSVRQTYYKVDQLPTSTSTPVVDKTDSSGDTTISTEWNDPDGDGLKGVIAWFTTNGNTYTQKVTSVTSSSYTGSNESDIGIMILSDKKIYLLNNDRTTWSYVGTNSAVIKNTSNENILSISNIATTTGSSGTYSFTISPIDGTKTSFCSTYTFYTTAIDNYMIVNTGDAGNYNITTGTKIDHTKMTSSGITRKFETNSLPTIPSTTGTLTIDGIAYPKVSTNSSSPTVVKYPSADNVTTYQPQNGTKPTGARQITTALNPSTFPRSIFPAGQTKTITETYKTQNRCDDNWLSASPRTVYYKTNNPPVLDNPDCSMTPDAQCTTTAILDDIGGPDSYTKVGTNPNGGCSTTTYTGIETNNPLKISIEAKDPDQNNEIKGAIVWFSKTSAPQSMLNRTATYSYTNPNDVGVMILDNQAYAITYDNQWALISDNILKKENGEELARITDISTTDQGADKKISFKITFNSTSTANPDGKYSVDILVLDTYLINSGWIDQSFIKHYFNWYFDLTKPFVDSFKHTIIDMQKMNVTWSLSDAQTNIKEYVINAYRSEKSAINTSISIQNNPNNIVLNLGTPPENEIGNPRNPNQWDYLNVNTTPVNVSSQIDISTNEGGSIDMYLTAFDQACNYITSSNNSVNLDPWISTKGGTLYSQGNILTNAKDLSSVDDSYYTISGLPTIKNATKYQLKIGSEVISSGSDFIRNVIESNKTSVRATNVTDTNDKVDEYYETLKKNLNRQQEGVVQIDNVNGCAEGEKCIMYTTEDITIPSGFVCDKSILFMTEGNIILNPNITGDNRGLHGCIFVAKQDIEILEGAYKSTSVVGYDYIEGFLYAGNQIKIPFTDGARVLRDGLEVYGGIVAMGKDLTHNGGESGVSQARNLRLFNDINPALVVVYDNKYSKISEIFYGKEAAIFKREVGYKPY